MTFAIQFDYPEGERLYAGMHKGAFGWAPTLTTAALYEDVEVALRVLQNAYGPSSRTFGRVVAIKSAVPT